MSVRFLLVPVLFAMVACNGDTTDDGYVEGSGGLTAEQIGDDSLFVVDSYDINGDELGNGYYGLPTEAAIDTFAIYTSLIPASFRTGVVAFVAIDQEQSGGTDGALQDVYGPDDEPTGDRFIALDITGYSTELERTIVHETGHWFSFEPGGTPNAYLNDFNAAFPPGAAYNADDFVTEYAASSEDGGEDFAESWAMYVFVGTDYAGDADGDGVLDTVPEGTLAADKVAFFADYPELVELRDHILAAAFE